MSNRNRTAGNGYELKVLKQLKRLFPRAITSRLGSRYMDSKGVDFLNTGKFHFQVKLSQRISPHKILNAMPDDKINVIIHGRTEKALVNQVLKEELVMLRLEDFLNLINGTNR